MIICFILIKNNLFCVDNDKLAGAARVKKRFFDLGFRRTRYGIPNLPKGSFDFLIVSMCVMCVSIMFLPLLFNSICVSIHLKRMPHLRKARGFSWTPSSRIFCFLRYNSNIENKLFLAKLKKYIYKFCVW